MKRARAVLVLATLGLCSCLPAAFPRTADVTPPGETTIAIGIHGGTLEAESATVRASPAAAPQTQSSALALPFGFDGNYAFGAWIGLIELSARYGLFPGCEGAIQGSLLRPGLEMRCRVMRESASAPFSLALSSGIYYSTFGQGPWGRAGLDASRWVSGVAPIVGAYVSMGPERHGFKVDVPPADTSNVYDEFGGGPYVYAIRKEIRLSVPLGVAFDTSDSPPAPRFALRARAPSTSRVTVGLVPYAALWTSGFAKERCIECGDATAGSVVANYGVSLALSYEVGRY